MKLTNEQVQKVVQWLDSNTNNLSKNQLTPILKNAALSDEKFAGMVLQFIYSYLGEGQNVLRYTTMIPGYAFSGLSFGSNTFYVPSTITEIRPYAFSGVEAESIKIDGGQVIPEFCFKDSKIKKIELGEGITTIDTNAFANCPNLELVVWPESLKLVKKGAFANCGVDTSKFEIECPGKLLMDADTLQFKIEDYNMDLEPDANGKTGEPMTDFYNEVIRLTGVEDEEEPVKAPAETEEASAEPAANATPPEDAPVEESLVEAKKDLGTVSGSMTSILKDNLKKFNTAKTVAELVDMIEKLFEEEGLDTKASNRLIATIEKKRNIGDAYMALYNSILSGSGLSVL